MLAWCREWGSQRLEMLKGQAESDLPWGDGVKEWVAEPTQWSRRFLAKLAALEASPQYSNPHSRPTLPHPHRARGRHSFHTQNTPGPSWMYFPGQLSVIQLRFCRLCIFQAPKLQSFPTVWLQLCNQLCLLYSFISPSQCHDRSRGKGNQEIFLNTDSFLFATLCNMWNFPDQGSNPAPLQQKHRVLPTGSPGKSQNTDSLL